MNLLVLVSINKKHQVTDITARYVMQRLMQPRNRCEQGSM